MKAISVKEKPGEITAGSNVDRAKRIKKVNREKSGQNQIRFLEKDREFTIRIRIKEGNGILKDL
jgi:hypothetical protein